MPTDKRELQLNVEALLDSIMRGAPGNIGAIVIALDKDNGNLVMRAGRLEKEKAREVLTAVLRGYGEQKMIVLPPGVDA